MKKENYIGFYTWWMMLAKLTKAATNYSWPLCLAIALRCIALGWYQTNWQKPKPAVQISLNRLRFVAAVDAASAEGWEVDIEKIGRDGYNAAEGLPVIHRQLYPIPEHLLPLAPPI